MSEFKGRAERKEKESSLITLQREKCVLEKKTQRHGETMGVESTQQKNA